MSRHLAHINWSLAPGADFAAGRYSRGYSMTFDGGAKVPGSASPYVVGNRWAVATAVDPEEMFIAAVSACHMLTFLHRARLGGHVVLSYSDEAEGLLSDRGDGRLALTQVTLRPTIVWGDDPPDAAQVSRLHDEAHDECFIANSVRTLIEVA